MLHLFWLCLTTLFGLPRFLFSRVLIIVTILIPSLPFLFSHAHSCPVHPSLLLYDIFVHGLPSPCYKCDAETLYQLY